MNGCRGSGFANQSSGSEPALHTAESIADDVKWGKRTSFPRAVKANDDETVVFA